MMSLKGKLKLYDLRGLAIVFALSTLFVMLPARSEGGDFLDNIKKLEIKDPPASGAASAESASSNLNNESRDKKMPPKQDGVSKRINQSNKTQSTINALRKQNAELSAAAKAAEKKLAETTRELSAQIAALKAQSSQGVQKESGDPAAVSALTKKNVELAATAEAVQQKLDETTRTLSAQIAALKAQRAQDENGHKSALEALRKKNAELNSAAEAAQKKLDDTTRTLSVQIAALKTQKGQSDNAQKSTIDTLMGKNLELSAAAAMAQKKLDETTGTLSAQIAALQKQNAQGESQQKSALDALNKKNAELSAAAEAAQKKLDETTRTLSAQIAALQKQNAQDKSQQKSALDALNKKNGELSAAAEAAQKKLDETTRTLSAQIAALQKQNTQGESQQKSALDALSKKNAELSAAAEAAQKKYAESVAALNNQNQKLQSALDSQAIKESELKLTDKSIKNAYALGVFYLTQALSDVNKMADNDVKLSPSALVSGFNDAYHKKLKIKEGEIETIVNTLNEQMSSKYVDIEKRIMAKIKNKKYEVLPNGVYFVIDKQGKQAYKQNESLSLNILEKKLDGTPILNTMNSRMIYDKQIDPLMAKVLTAGLKGGAVTLYGQAGSLYSTTPADINPDTLISITFELIP
ncbi:FKBP-type peptidyl-prolyl cis-trans isomerase N-terminal domain-containing protein [Klebsiella oxytoca]|uniref:FKBP-type peptidyl-prolyl cis-trans isomerase N-terminal domain-containing protein n=2 Tax=Klebsiella oxytoca TaxID=571 RepID=UPI0007CC6ABD|nr:FKBP-type peptidyl-prolyl cis-trans isomerase N-terminal domain-containing protein [Klebsiella oxytoca]EGT0043717.1 cell envelope biogenesis protein TolA [Klebsiella oxytoca]ELR0728025.1 cell envelope biogenesis protein TolA [Klebsiella oxytoca]MEC5327384.1 FKBP-type peptidyl-prolyl cis-trans isomerase N-terminal domain-containing protein [Klebsiella oxytoca]MEC5356313.1 FKBP-type peptidyl-prolyl cis-trans isomerase N-terminal domain-containing protein [Klebsiella oxytoca]PDO73370.1 cell en